MPTSFSRRLRVRREAEAHLEVDVNRGTTNRYDASREKDKSPKHLRRERALTEAVALAAHGLLRATKLPVSSISHNKKQINAPRVSCNANDSDGAAVHPN